MRRFFLALLMLLVAGAAVWYAVTFPPRTEDRSPLGAPGSPERVGQLSAPPLGAECGRRCGTERWAVKTLSDGDRAVVNLRPVDATVEALVLLPRNYAHRGRARLLPVEGTVYRVEGYLSAAYPENDGDWHMVLFGRMNQRVSLIAEIPDPTCSGACRSGLAREFAQARQLLRERLARSNPKDRPIIVRVTGVGFFDRSHGQAWAAPNGFELHPVLRVEFIDGRE